MPRRTAPLSDTQIRLLKPQAKEVKLFDGGGLYLLGSPSGGKHWRLKYRFGGRERLLSLGAYPYVTLSEARQKREQAKEMIAKGIDPGAVKQAQKEAQTQEEETVEVVAREWLTKQTPTWAPTHTKTIKSRLESFIFPHLGTRPISGIKPLELLNVLRKIEARGTVETAHRVKQICGQIFRYALATGRAESDPTVSLRGALASVKVKHMAAITDRKGVAGLLRAMDEYEGSIIVKSALRMSPLVFARPGELRRMEWAEIDFETAIWTIPAAKMKMRKIHAVPLSRQALAILGEIKPFTGEGPYVFPSARGAGRPMSDMAILAALRRMGIDKEEMTAHGFRSMASSLLHENGWDSTLIELQLAHQDTNTVRSIYNRSERLDERRKMMQSWADYLDALKEGVNVMRLQTGTSLG